jgi:hypothetical protein
MTSGRGSSRDQFGRAMGIATRYPTSCIVLGYSPVRVLSCRRPENSQRFLRRPEGWPETDQRSKLAGADEERTIPSTMPYFIGALLWMILPHNGPTSRSSVHGKDHNADGKNSDLQHLEGL